MVGKTREYKYKPPTCDVKLSSGCLYLNGKQHIFKSFIKKNLPDGIYEIYLQNNEPIILRRRLDRQHAATTEAFEIFLDTSNRWLRCINSIIIGEK